MQIELRGLVKSYARVPALDGLSMQIASGQIVSLLGPNGAGKTTMLRCLAGIAAPDRGAVYFDGQEFRRDRMDLRRRLHFLPDFPILFPRQSVLRNVAIVLRLFEADHAGAEERVMDLLRAFDLLPLALRPAASLSRGQAYKASLIALIAADPELWLLDEPLASGMDPHGIDAFKHHARDAARRGRTILYSTQLLDVAERFSDRVCVIEKGAIRAFDTLDALRARAGDKDHVLEELFRHLRESRA
jgi:ABC-type multidrug transport system ATPase subunit